MRKQGKLQVVWCGADQTRGPYTPLGPKVSDTKRKHIVRNAAHTRKRVLFRNVEREHSRLLGTRLNTSSKLR